MKVVFIFLTVLATATCFSQEKTTGTKVYNKDFKWTIIIPAGYDTVTAEVRNAMQDRGSAAIENTLGEKVENNSKPIFTFRKGMFDYFESNYQAFDSTKDGSYIDVFNDVNKVLYQTFEAQMKGARIDSSTSTATISGLVFHKFQMAVTFPNNMVMNMYTYSRLFGKRDLNVYILAVDRAREKELLDCWLNSTFAK